jgi:hypothetical protein
MAVAGGIDATYMFWRFRIARLLLPVWLLGCAYVTNAAWSPSPRSRPGPARVNRGRWGGWSRA